MQFSHSNIDKFGTSLLDEEMISEQASSNNSLVMTSEEDQNLGHYQEQQLDALKQINDRIKGGQQVKINDSEFEIKKRENTLYQKI